MFWMVVYELEDEVGIVLFGVVLLLEIGIEEGVGLFLFLILLGE